MAVGQHQPVRRDNNAGTHPGAAARDTGLNPHNGWSDLIHYGCHSLRVSIQEAVVSVAG
jgi:hypothetical protein